MRQALARGCEVTAFVRDPARLDLQDARLRLAQGDILDPGTVTAALATRPDAVISALGIFHRKPETWLSTGTANIIEAMRGQGVRRLVCVSSLGAGDSRGQGSLLAKWLQWFLLRHVLDDKTRQEDLIRASGLDWTIFRPPQLTLDPQVRSDVVLWSGKAPRQRLAWKVSRATVAHCALEAAVTGSHVDEALNMSDPA